MPENYRDSLSTEDGLILCTEDGVELSTEYQDSTSYYDIYTLRLNRYGKDYQSRIQTKREKEFDLYLEKSVYRVKFFYNNAKCIASLEKYKQDDTRTLQYLLTKVDLNIPNGTILKIPNKDNICTPWMVYYLENIEASGYNRYILLKMSHFITWTARDGSTCSSWAYMYGQEDNMLKDEIRSRSRMDTLYGENLKSSFFVMPTNPSIRKDDYIIIGNKPLQEYYRVTGYDIQSSKGVEYVTVDPIYEYDQTPTPEPQQGDNPADFFWLNGGTTPTEEQGG